MGIETPAPVAYIELKSGGLLQHSFFVSENCSYPRMMREFEEGGIAGREDILEAFAAFTVDLHKKGSYIWTILPEISCLTSRRRVSCFLLST